MPSKTLKLSPRRKWFFRFLIIVAFPLLALGLIELALGLAGYGYRTSFFVPRQIGGQAMLVENARFGWRFFPPAIARSPTPAAMRAEKPAGVFRIFLFGESAALGDPRPAYGAGRYLETLLRERYPGTEFEVVCAAMTAINSHAIVPIARECARYQGDLWIVYMGNNEYLGPFGPSTIFSPASLPLSAVRAYLALQKTRAGQLWVALAAKFGASASAKQGWSGLKMFQQNLIPPGDTRRESVNANFRRNLEDIVRAGTRSGASVILSGMAANLKDCAPFGSLHAPALAASERVEWERVCQAGATNADAGNWAAAAKFYREAVRLSPQYAELQFRLGHCLLGLGDFVEARKCFSLARDLDALPFRADSKLNAAVKQAAERYSSKGVGYLDTERALQSESHPILGRELFYEHVHLNFDGNYRLARAWAEEVKSRLPSGMTNRQTAAWAEPEACALNLGLTDWNRYSVLDEISRRLLDAPYTGQFNHKSQVKQFMIQIAEMKERLHPRGYMDARTGFDEALKKRPQDFWLHQNYAEFLESAGEPASAAVQWQMVRDLLPHHHAAYFQAGRLLSRLGKYDEAKKSLEAALAVRPDLAEAYLELGQIQANQRKWDEALKQYDLAQKSRPDDARVFLRRAEVLAAQTKRPEAIQAMRDAIKLRPSYWEARYLLGVELAVDGKLKEAQTEFEEVVRLRPDHIRAHFNLGVALAKQNRNREAILEFQETLSRDPEHKQAKQYLDALQAMDKKN
jgi:tetratricopeptide (TPR) repeat protein